MQSHRFTKITRHKLYTTTRNSMINYSYIKFIYLLSKFPSKLNNLFLVFYIIVTFFTIDL